MQQYITFKIDDALFGVNVFYVLEINSKKEYTNVFGVSEKVFGLLNLRGDIVTMLDLRNILGIESSSYRSSYKNVILKTNEEVGSLKVEQDIPLEVPSERIGFVVDAVEDIITVDDVEMKMPPAVDRERYEITFVKGIFECEKGLLIVIDIGKIIDNELHVD